MSSLAMLMQNYSDSEDGSSDEERKRKKFKRRSRDESLIEDDLKKDELKGQSDASDQEEQSNKIELNTESTSLINSPEITPTLDQMKLEKPNNQHHSTNELLDFHQDYLEDDFHTMHTNGNDEIDTNDDSNSSIIDDDSNSNKANNNEIDDADTSSKNKIDKLDFSRYSPKSYHRLLIGTDEANIEIPDAPAKQCSDELTEQVIQHHNKMKQGMDMMKFIKKRKEFCNPSIYEKLISYCNIDEFGTNLPPEIFDPNLFRPKEPSEHEKET